MDKLALKDNNIYMYKVRTRYSFGQKNNNKSFIAYCFQFVFIIHSIDFDREILILIKRSFAFEHFSLSLVVMTVYSIKFIIKKYNDFIAL